MGPQYFLCKPPEIMYYRNPLILLNSGGERDGIRTHDPLIKR